MKGFTLIELIIYLAIAATILSLLISFTWNIIFGSIKTTANLEVAENARFAMMKIVQEAKKSTGINSPLSGSPAIDSLSLAMANPVLNPTVFDVMDGKLRISQGGGQAQELTSNLVRVSDLRFTNLSYPDTPGTLQIQLTVDYFNPENRQDYRASIQLNSTVSLAAGGAGL